MSAILNTYNRKKLSFKKGKGSYLYAANGKKYLDFVQGIAVNCLGHTNNYLIKSIYKQSKKLWHISNVFTIPEQERLAKRLTQKTFADFVAFQNSGAEATFLFTNTAPIGNPPPMPFAICLLYTSPSPRDGLLSRMPSSA